MASGRSRSARTTIRVLLGGQMVLKSFGFAYPFMTFLLRNRGYGPSLIGLVIAVFGAGWITGQLLCGWLADRSGRRATLLAAMLVGAVALPVLALSRGLPALLGGAVVAGAIYDAPRPIISAAVADLVPDDAQRLRTLGWLHWGNNVGAALVGAVGGFLASRIGPPNLVLINAGACALVAVIIFFWVPADDHAKKAAEGRYREVLADARLWLLVGASLCALVLILSMYSSLPLLMAADRLPASAFGTVQFAAASTVILMTPAMSRWLGRIAKGDRSMVTVVAVGSTAMGIGMGLAALAHSTLGYGAAVVASIPGEIAIMIAAPALLTRIAPEHLRARYFSVWGMAIAVASGLAPLLTSWSLSHGGKPMAAATTLAVGLCGAVLCIPLAHRASRSRFTAQPDLVAEVAS